MTLRQRARRCPTAALGLTTLMTTVIMSGCSSAPSHPAAPAAAAPPGARTSASAIDSRGTTAATTAIAEAISATQALRAYSFSALQDVRGTHETRSTLTGQAIRPASVGYLLLADGRRTQVIRLLKATYLKVGSGHWSRARSTTSPVDPASSLIKLLRAVQAPTVGSAGPGQMLLHSLIPATATRAAGLSAGSGAADVTITLNAHHQVTRLQIRTDVTRPGNATAHVSLTTDYANFNAVPPLRPPV
jgi:uncharacterized protein YceK